MLVTFSVLKILSIVPLLPVYPGGPTNQRMNSKKQRRRIANGRLHHDPDIGNFTYCAQSGLSVVDYLLLHPSDIHTISEFTV